MNMYPYFSLFLIGDIQICFILKERKKTLSIPALSETYRYSFLLTRARITWPTPSQTITLEFNYITQVTFLFILFPVLQHALKKFYSLVICLQFKETTVATTKEYIFGPGGNVERRFFCLPFCFPHALLSGYYPLGHKLQLLFISVVLGKLGVLRVYLEP